MPPAEHHEQHACLHALSCRPPRHRENERMREAACLSSHFSTPQRKIQAEEETQREAECPLCRQRRGKGVEENARLPPALLPRPVARISALFTKRRPAAQRQAGVRVPRCTDSRRCSYERRYSRAAAAHTAICGICRPRHRHRRRPSSSRENSRCRGSAAGVRARRRRL